MYSLLLTFIHMTNEPIFCSRPCDSCDFKYTCWHSPNVQLSEYFESDDKK